MGIAGRYILAAVETLPADPTRLRIQIGRHKAVNAAHDREISPAERSCSSRKPAGATDRPSRQAGASRGPGTMRYLAVLRYETTPRCRRDGRRQASIREAAEALFRPPEPRIDPVTPAAAVPTDQPMRKQRVLAAVSAPSNQHDPTETVVSVKPSRTPATIPAAHSGRIRTLVKDGMTPWQVTPIYRVEVDEVRRLLKAA